MRPWTDWTYEENEIVDETKVPWPIYRDWTQEAAQLSKTIVRTKNAMIAEERNLDLAGGRAKNPDKLEFHFS